MRFYSTPTIRWIALASLSAIVWALPACGVAAGAERGRVRVVRHGRCVFIRSAFSPQEDLLVRVGKGSNGQVNFSNVWLISASSGMGEADLKTGRLIHANGDDSTPWNINGTYIGANHGCSDARELTCKGHGRTAGDLGSIWTDEAGSQFCLIKIVDSDRLWLLACNTGKGDVWRFNRKYVGSTLRSESRAAALTFTDVRMVQLRPACRIRAQQYLLDGKTPLGDAKPASCRYFDIVEEYDIVNPASLLRDMTAHPGMERDFVADHLDGVIRNRIVYRFHPNGANVIYYDAQALQDFRLGYMGFVQSARLHKGKYDAHEYYIPKTVPFTQDGRAHDFQTMVDYSARPQSPLRFQPANNNVEDPQNLPERFIQFLGRREGGQTVRQVGYALGYSLIHGLTRPAERAKNANRAIMLYTSSKSYPVAIDGKMARIVPAGTRFHCVAYRQYFRPGAQGRATCVYWHEEKDDTVIYIDYHQSVERDVVRLPGHLAGKALAVVEKTESVTLHTAEIVPDAGVVLSVRGGYGYVVLKAN